MCRSHNPAEILRMCLTTLFGGFLATAYAYLP